MKDWVKYLISTIIIITVLVFIPYWLGGYGDYNGQEYWIIRWFAGFLLEIICIVYVVGLIKLTEFLIIIIIAVKESLFD